MAEEATQIRNRVKEFREGRGWSQQELADRTGLSRTGISAIEMGKLVPSTVAALMLSRVFGCKVEELFQLNAPLIRWAWPPAKSPWRYWQVVVGGKHLLIPVEPSPLGMVPHDGVFEDGKTFASTSSDPFRTLVVACCDPAIGLLAAEYARMTPFRMLVLSRSSRQGLQLLREGVVHIAGLHLAESKAPDANAAVVREILNAPATLLRVANWQSGVMLAPGLGLKTIANLTASGVRWVGREPGSGARQVLDEVLKGAPPPALTAKDHRGVAEAVRSGWAEAGISLRLVSEEAGLDFISVREEAYDLCIPESHADDPRVQALFDVVRSKSFRHLLRELPGYDGSVTGDSNPVTVRAANE
ncbi:substrate-binding domain-containing protein [Geomesophilobacter sediminis]|uniref:Helix-turn-helix domain-containing protein n=1 Tax=Geomesophilobacter sediminis TaxID=2798584 RepID=A0A8J7M0G5_9BACT|nr:substrate-binding domain-containing protein [Geomesophilobacter sediminis]MBJ6725067.1 helix-turn-helix domain-containing protein [Geomesophilobacter sediminis]